MIFASLVIPSAESPSGRQRSLRCRTRHLSLRSAVRVAADGFFGFRNGASKTPSLWSSVEHVWLGRETFLHWAMWDAEINIPWVVAEAVDAPRSLKELRAAVGEELAAYWKSRLNLLPREGTPCWPPLP
jgi:hypothetical protein